MIPKKEDLTPIPCDLKDLNEKEFLHEYGNFIKESLKVEKGLVDVSKVYVNENTYEKFKEAVKAQTKKYVRTKKSLNDNVSFTLLQFGPVVLDDIGLEDDILYVSDDVISEEDD